MAIEINILGEISDWGYSAQYLKYQFDNANGEDINLNISSPGGSVVDGLAMADIISMYPGKVNTLGFGLVASIATIPLLSGSTVRMTENSFFMIHRPWSMATGTSSDLNQTAEVLDKMETQLQNIYVSKLEKSNKLSGNLALKVKRMMDAETWLTAQEAYDMGFIDEIVSANDMRAVDIIAMQARLQTYQHTPAALLINKNEQMSLIDQIKNLLSSSEQVDVQDEPQNAIELNEETAKALLLQQGYVILTQDEHTALIPKVEEAAKPSEETEALALLATELKNMKAEMKRLVATQSGGTTEEKKKEEEKPVTFGNFAKLLKTKP